MQPLFRGLLNALILLCLIIHPARAQSEWIARLIAPDSSQFPTVQVYLDIHDASGNFLHDIQSTQVTIIESGKRLTVSEIVELRQGLQVVIAINPGLSFAIRNSQAVSRYDLLIDSLRTWARNRLGTTTDDWSLLVGGEGEISHTSDPADIINGLETFQEDPRLAQPSIDILARAVSMASDATPRDGMGRSVLFITSALEGDVEQAIRDISEQARQQDISVSVWLVASRGALITQSVQQLNALAASTGGEVFTFSGEEEIPNPDQYLDAMRYIYLLSFESQVGLSGTHDFSAEIQLADEQVLTNTLSFQVDLLPPEPALVSPPISIERILPERVVNEPDIAIAEGLDSNDLLSPKEFPLQVVFDFPDGRKRDLVSSALLVNGNIVAQNLEPPFDQFVWNLEKYTTDEVVQLQIQSIDELGLTGTSIEIPVQISVASIETDPWFVIRRNLVTISVLLVLMAGGLLFLVLVLGGKLRPVTQITANRSSTRKLPGYTISEAHLAQTIKSPSRTNRIQDNLSKSNPEAKAFLVRISGQDGPGKITPIPITDVETIIGSDPSIASFLIEDPSIEAAHAQLKCNSAGDFWIFDMQSIAGTWVNYSPVPGEGAKLSQGDLVHFGRIGFQFSINIEPHTLKPGAIIETNGQERSAQEITGKIKENAP